MGNIKFTFLVETEYIKKRVNPKRNRTELSIFHTVLICLFWAQLGKTSYKNIFIYSVIVLNHQCQSTRSFTRQLQAPRAFRLSVKIVTCRHSTRVTSRSTDNPIRATEVLVIQNGKDFTLSKISSLVSQQFIIWRLSAVSCKVGS